MALVEQSPGKARHVVLAIVLAASESVTSKQSWRYPTHTDTVYFAQLAAWGYDLSEVEQIITNTTGDGSIADDGETKKGPKEETSRN
ncbi:hypothetical protein [Leifsonia sp. NPDC058248]|uniref:hypothetical protein n=1 Tax=Leifsonia sp. NPDC058248 TaxID=3346402 RepID=UPI0036DE4EDF